MKLRLKSRNLTNPATAENVSVNPFGLTQFLQSAKMHPTLFHFDTIQKAFYVLLCFHDCLSSFGQGWQNIITSISEEHEGQEDTDCRRIVDGIDPTFGMFFLWDLGTFEIILPWQ